MQDESNSKEDRLKLSVLAKLEELIEGFGEVAMMLGRSIFVAPTYFLRSNPFELISQALAARRILPPLLFLVLAILPVPVFVTILVEASMVFNPELYAADRWSQLKLTAASDVFLAAGPAVLAIWLVAKLASLALARLTNWSHESTRSTLLYMCNLSFVSASLAVMLIIASVEMPGGVGGLPKWLSWFGIPLLAWIIPTSLPLMLAWHLSRSTWRHFKAHSSFARTLASAISLLVPLGVLVLAVARLCCPEPCQRSL